MDYILEYIMQSIKCNKDKLTDPRRAGLTSAAVRCNLQSLARSYWTHLVLLCVQDVPRMHNVQSKHSAYQGKIYGMLCLPIPGSLANLGCTLDLM